jgi:hypothetical protein
MPLLDSIKNLVRDPPPAYLFELSEAGIAFAHHGRTGFEALPPQTLVASPVEDNLKRLDLAAATIEKIAPPSAGANPNGNDCLLSYTNTRAPGYRLRIFFSPERAISATSGL